MTSEPILLAYIKYYNMTLLITNSDIDECATNTDDCDNDTTTCVNNYGGFSCSCNTGFQFLSGSTTACEGLSLLANIIH